MRGGKRAGAGRPKGSQNLATIELTEAAKKFAPDALAALHHVAVHGKNESARVQASTALLDRGYGRPRQALEHSGSISGGGVLAVPMPPDAVQWAATAAAQQALLLGQRTTTEDGEAE